MLHLVADVSTTTSTLSSINMITLAVSSLAGLVIPPFIDLVLKATIPTQFKTLLAMVLSAIAGAISTVTFTPLDTWQNYVFAVMVAFVNTLASHVALKYGLGDPIQSRTGHLGIGPRRANTARRHAA